MEGRSIVISEQEPIPFDGWRSDAPCTGCVDGPLLSQGGKRDGAVLASNVFVRTKTACQGNAPETPDKLKGGRPNMIPFMIGLMAGGTFGVMIMCLVQINRDDRMEDFQ